VQGGGEATNSRQNSHHDITLVGLACVYIRTGGREARIDQRLGTICDNFGFLKTQTRRPGLGILAFGRLTMMGLSLFGESSPATNKIFWGQVRVVAFVNRIRLMLVGQGLPRYVALFRYVLGGTFLVEESRQVGCLAISDGLSPDWRTDYRVFRLTRVSSTFAPRRSNKGGRPFGHLACEP